MPSTHYIVLLSQAHCFLDSELFFFAQLVSSISSSIAREKYEREQQEKERQAREEERKERIARMEYTKQFKEEFPEMFREKSPETEPLDTEDEFVAWYQSLTDQQKKIMIIELDNQQLHYDVNHGFDSEGYSSYYNSNQYYADRTNLMYKWKASWNKTSESD